ncbi:hypothetical protein SRRS_45460 [Sporomusa rhizae]|uniref:hypothetical protein n=1 Tax=Sporomusa rhizae TaxID=357999 RepID=UPI00352B5222
MNILPYRVITIIATMSTDEAINILKPHVNNNYSFLTGNLTFFRGNIHGHTFEMHRRFSGRNSFMPIIIGVVREHPQGCEIKITIRLSLVLLVFVAAVLYMDAIAFSKGTWFFPIITSLVLVFLYLIAWQIYDGEAIQATNFLRGLWKIQGTPGKIPCPGKQNTKPQKTI